MSASSFDELLALVWDHLSKQDTRLHLSVPADERLAVTLRHESNIGKKIRLRKHAFPFCLARYGLVYFFACIIVLIIILNFIFQSSTPVYRAIPYKNNFKDAGFLNLNVNPKEKILVDHVEYNNNQSQVSVNKCEIVHIGVVCSGYKSILQFFTMVKSIFFYRNNPLHLHIMVNKLSEKVLKTLFETWAVPQVNVSFYDINGSILDVRWVPNSHYSGMHGLLKLVFPKVILSSVTNKLIVIDTDLTFTSDIFELWQLFEKFNHKQAIGLVDNQSDYYIRKTSNAWPAVGRGYNTGVILYNFPALKRIAWDRLWERITKKAASLYGATKLADQDIINTVIKQNPDIIFQVPCFWNTQLSDQSLSYMCYKNNQIKVVHWNSPRKYNVLNKDGDYFRSIYKTFLEINGNLLKRQLYDCSNTSKNITNEKPNVCSEFFKAQNETYRTLLFFRRYDYVPSRNDVTFATQLSYDRLQMIEELCKHWNGPISITLYVSDPEFQESISYIDQSEILQDRNNIAYHAVFKDGVHHPINVLRNVGLRNINTPFVFLADIDFLPMYGLYNNIKNAISLIKNMDKKALVVPAFETQAYRNRFPKSKIELLQMIDNKVIFTFRHDVWAPGHAPTNYEKWKTVRTPYVVKWERDYEPYIVVRSDVIDYDNRFMGFGWNKVSHIMELEAQEYTFIVLPSAFIIHKPHAPSYDIAKFRESPIYRMCIQNLKEEFVAMLKEKYGRTFESKNNSFVPPV